MKIDINADVGEGIGNEKQLLPYLSSCNIACGGHAGNKKTMRTVVNLAIANKVKIGAHPSFPDPANFGRQPMPFLSNNELLNAIKEQIQELANIVSSSGANLHHIKAHGALYNMAATNTEIAEVVIEAVSSISKALRLVVPFKSVIETLALQNNRPIIYEAFADRNYNDDYTLVSRDNKKALLTQPESVFQQVYYIATTKNIKTLSGKVLPIKADTYCIHGDNKEAIAITKYVFNNLLERGIGIEKR